MAKECVLIGASLLNHIETHVMAQHLAKLGKVLCVLERLYSAFGGGSVLCRFLRLIHHAVQSCIGLANYSPWAKSGLSPVLQITFDRIPAT